MASLTIDILDSHFEILQDLAKLYGVPVELLLRASLDQWLSTQTTDFTDATDHVLTKNAELYQRLA